jgi:hypothetical protein
VKGDQRKLGGLGETQAWERMGKSERQRVRVLLAKHVDIYEHYYKYNKEHPPNVA